MFLVPARFNFLGHLSFLLLAIGKICTNKNQLALLFTQYKEQSAKKL